ncbi:MAG: histidine phosphatase family protein [Firmicutes bacterium]|nr:histidine phosphatase family protein [Bacillota bacterium]
MAVRLYLVRHGETEWNKAGRIQGQQNPPLNELGRRQAEMVAEYLAGLSANYDQIYSSDLLRARQTAEAIAAKCNGRIVFRRELREQCFGVCEGFLVEEARAKFGIDLRAYLRNPAGTTLPDGESLEAMGARAAQFLAEVRGHEGQSVIVVSHGGLIKTLLTLILGMQLHYRNRLEIANAAVSVVSLAKTGDKVLALNLTHHLAQIS